MFQKDCPCYTCLVASMCPGKELTEEEWDEVNRQVDEDDRNGVNSWYHEDNEEILDSELLEIPEMDAQRKCPYYKEWQYNLNELDSWLGKDMEDIKCP